jgi:hypothetical protein
MALSHLGYLKYCEDLNLKVPITNLNTYDVYYWHSNCSSDVIPVQFYKLNGNTFLFEFILTGNKIGLSSNDGTIYGLSNEPFSKNTFNYTKYL